MSMVDFYEDRGRPGWIEGITEDMILSGQRRTTEWASVWAAGLGQVYNDQQTGKSAEKDEDGKPINTDVQINRSFPTLMQDMAIQAQRRPMIMVEAHDEQPEDDTAAEIWQGILQHQYMNELGMPELNTAASLDAFCFGIYIAKTFWEPKAEWDIDNRKWIGKPQSNLLFPPYFGADPEAEVIDMSTAYVYSGRRVSLDWVLRRWGTTAEMKQKIIDAAEKDPHNTDYARAMNAAWGPSFSPHATSEDQLASSFQREDGSGLAGSNVRGRILRLINTARGYGSTGDKDNYSGRPRKLTLFEVYFRDLTEGQKTDVKPISREELIDNESIIAMADGTFAVGNPEAFKDSAPHLKEGDTPSSADWPMRTNQAFEPDFPRGRFVLKIGTDLILNPKESEQVYPYRQWPYVTGVYHELPHIWEGMNGTEMPEPIQTYMNSTYTSLLNLMKYWGDPTLIVDKLALADETLDVISGPGEIINVKEGKIDNVAKFLEPASVPPGTFKIVELLDRNIQGQGGKHDQSLGQGSKANVTATEIAAKQEALIIRSGLQIQRRDAWNKKIMELVVEMDQANLEPGQIVQMTGKDFDARRGEMTQALLDLEFGIKLKIGTGLPFDRERERQKWERLADRFGPLPVAKELLEAFEVDNVDEVLARVEGYPQFLAFMEELQAQQEEAAQQQEQTAAGAV